MERAIGIVEGPDPFKIGMIVIVVILIITIGFVLVYKPKDKKEDKKKESKQNTNTAKEGEVQSVEQNPINPVQPK